MCPYSSTNKEAIKIHFKRKHAKEKPFKCLVCGVAKFRKYAVLDHWQRVHSKGQDKLLEHVCDICGKRFTCPSELSTHTMVHNYPTFICRVCGKPFKTAKYLKTHEKRHTEVRVPCNKCGKILAGANEAKQHEEAVHSSKSSVDCDVCGKTLKCKTNLKLHISTMHDQPEKPHHCQICKSSFRVQSILQKHIETVHEKSRQLQCPYCETLISNKDRFKRHSKRKHGGIKLPQDLGEQSRSKIFLQKVDII
jgi:KRAB domain-containing zinc finger protein